MDNTWAFVMRRSSDLYDVLSAVEDDGLDAPEWMQRQIERLGKNRSAVVRNSYLNTTLGYQLISGRRHGTRDKLIQLSFGMGLDIAGTSELLERNGLSRLRPTDYRDVAIAFCISRHLSVPQCDETLWRAGIEPLRSGYPDV